MRFSLFQIALATVASCTSAFTVSHSNVRFNNALAMSEEAAEEARRTGVVKWFNTEKGFGFIVPDNGDKDVFVHQTNINVEGFRSLADGESVEYDLMEDPQTGKVKAADVTGPGRTDVQGAPFEAGY